MTRRASAPPAITAYGNTWTGVAAGTGKEVKRAEAALGLHIPEELADLLMTCGGGSPGKTYFSSRDNDIELELGYVIPLVDRPKIAGVVAECQVHRRVHELSPELIPFALDSGHANLICMRLPARDIVYWLHDDPDDRVRPVAQSLEALLRGLTDPPY